ncbi:hypothetical protein SAMN04488527_10396 [Aliiroseovarius crassostreae]|uniref:Uncharacterized protein n=1 Tax=Aliiroseovarius crassostreae TaxID=154981 RepID=A0A0P7J281_9RHOB|nr:hypothetical protein [Aliiroseovarius crassostreae]KPN61748.1 hypothetical protein AKJ29_03865 [Aliiroseovarius crassostreae]SFU45842.1 hypothetical protein SAMN04488527_10396 [Aliiroseovarius crassostreae]
MSHKPTRETKPSDWKVIDAFFTAALDAKENGEMSDEQYKYWVTHFVGLANNEGIENVLDAMNTVLGETPIKWSM